MLLFFAALLLPQASFAQTGPSNWTASPFSPPALPLAVRSPYLNVWIPQGNNPLPAYNRDNFAWTYSQALQWYTSVVVDTREYRLLSPWAAGELTANQTAVEFTATRTSFLMEAGGVRFNMSFLSPIEANNFTIQSLPFTYLYMTAQSLDGSPHRVRMYSDIEGNLVAGDVSQVIQWAAEESDDHVVLSTRLQSQQPFTESNAQAQDGTVYYSFKKLKGSTNTTWRISGFNSARGQLFSNPAGGVLDRSVDGTFRAPSSGDNTPVFGISIDWGNITSTSEPAVWALGFHRNQSIQYMKPDGSFQSRPPYFMSSMNNPINAVKFVLDDFPRALSSAVAFDARIRTDGAAISSQYADLLTLSARQAMGAMEITLPPPGNGGKSWDTSDVKIFMKNIGSAGSDSTLASVNNVDVLYASFPVFLYLNPEIGGYLLAPLLEYQDSDAYRLPYAAKNLGSRYPNAVADGINLSHQFGVDETAGMIIMTLAYSLASGNGNLISKHYGLLRRWTEYLENNTVTPVNQASSDLSANSDPPASNQTNVALKGIIAIAAMSKMAEAMGNADDQSRFNASSRRAIDFWQTAAVSSSGINHVYGAPEASTLAYNLYADKLLRLNLVPQRVYDVSTSSYQASSGSFKYGIPLHTSFQNTSTNWMMFAASTANSDATRDALISQVHSYASNNLNDAPFASMYDPSTGRGATTRGSDSGRASPAQGGLFALLALGTTTKTITVGSSNGGSSSGNKLGAGPIAGLVIAALVAVGIFIVVAVLLYRRRRDSRRDADRMTIESHELTPTTTHLALPTSYTPFTATESLNPSSVTTRLIDSKHQPSTSYSASRSEVILSPSSTRPPDDGVSSYGEGSVDHNVVHTLRQELVSLRNDVERLRADGEFAAPPSYYSDSTTR